MGKYNIFYLAFKNIMSKIALNGLAVISLVIAISSLHIYMVLFRYSTEDAYIFISRFSILTVFFVTFIFVLLSIVIFLVFHINFIGRLKMFAVFATFGARKVYLFIMVLIEYILILIFSAIIALIIVPTALYINSEYLSFVLTLPKTFNGVLGIFTLGLQSGFLVALIALFALLAPALYHLNRDPSAILRDM